RADLPAALAFDRVDRGGAARSGPSGEAVLPASSAGQQGDPDQGEARELRRLCEGAWGAHAAARVARASGADRTGSSPSSRASGIAALNWWRASTKPVADRSPAPSSQRP